MCVKYKGNDKVCQSTATILVTGAAFAIANIWRPAASAGQNPRICMHSI